jgi:hypothetical protein
MTILSLLGDGRANFAVETELLNKIIRPLFHCPSGWEDLISVATEWLGCDA